MNTDFAILLFWFGISVTANIGLTFAWFHMRKRVRQLESRPVDLSHLDDLAARVQNSFVALSPRIDGLVTSQGFLSRGLTGCLDRLGRAPPAPSTHHPPP